MGLGPEQQSNAGLGHSGRVRWVAQDSYSVCAPPSYTVRRQRRLHESMCVIGRFCFFPSQALEAALAEGLPEPSKAEGLPSAEG